MSSSHRSMAALSSCSLCCPGYRICPPYDVAATAGGLRVEPSRQAPPCLQAAALDDVLHDRQSLAVHQLSDAGVDLLAEVRGYVGGDAAGEIG